jgi:DNA-binding transcriptional regulator YiaG
MGRRIALSNEQVKMIRENVEGLTQKQWAVKFEVSVQTIQNAKKGYGVYGKDTTEG